MSFCECYFNKYIHHIPNTSDQPLQKEVFKNGLALYLSFIYDNLGEDTVVKWFDS